MATPLATLMLGETGIQHLWVLNETTGTTAVDSKGTQNGTYNNGATLNQAGIIPSETNNCPSFANASAQFVNLNTTAIAPTGTAAFTWEAWVYPTSAAIGNIRVLGADDANTNGPSLMYDGPNAQWHAWRSSSGTQISAAAGAANLRYHVVLTYDGRTLLLYVNGNSKGGIIDTTAITTIGGAFNIGASGNFGSFWQGKAQYVALYSVALNGDQIRKHYQTGVQTLPAATNVHSYGAYVNTGQSWDANPPTNYGELDTFTGWATNNGASTHKPGVFHSFCNYANNAHFPVALAQQANQRGAEYMVTWEAWDPGAAGTGGHKADQPTYALQNIINGAFDAYLNTWAADIMAYGLPVILRIFHEFNGDYYPWGTVLDGNNNNQSDYMVGGVLSVNTEARVAQAFQHVRTLFNNAGVTNVKWCWCANIFLDNYSNHPFTAASYPGDAYVDYTALDVLNYSQSSSTSLWMPLFDFMSVAYDTIAAITSKPMILPEVASSEDGTGFYTKANWLTQAMGTTIPQSFPLVQIYLAVDDAADPSSPSLSVNSSAAALAAFQAQVASAQYAAGMPQALPQPTLTSVSPNSVPVGTGPTLTATGTGFEGNSVINWNGAPLTTTYGSGTTLTAPLPASNTAAPGTGSVTVTTPGQASTAAQTVTITSSAPTITSISPSTLPAGGAGFTLTVNGTNFLSTAVVLWNGVGLTTTFVSSTQLTAAVPASDIATPGDDTVQVTQ